MHTLSVKLTFHIPHSSSLKDKRQACRSLIDKARYRFNAAIAEVDTLDAHRTLTIGIAVLSGGMARAQKQLDEILRYMEENADAELIEIEEW
ncbi:MAG: DUF503 domain-containing protein [Defluviitaleaceae bacterium]|nr:DUF503 domain-containing protein [Defluviitaleaceae bacterium]